VANSEWEERTGLANSDLPLPFAIRHSPVYMTHAVPRKPPNRSMQHPAPSDTRAIRWWLFVVAACVVATLVIGGATRLTESGLSIVEWKPVTGTLPPFAESAWRAEFEKYQAIPQYQALNRGMTLAEFKTIYWWEWAHRMAARLTGAAFLLPFLWFLWRGRVAPALRPRLWVIFGLGALQGAIGWWMVASGLEHRVDVSQYRLALHLTLACVVYAAIVWTAVRLRRASSSEAPGRIRAGAVGLLALVLVQIYLGALVAGLDAGLIYNTWPLIDGRLVPPAAELFASEPFWRNMFENRLTVQFDHRMMAYVLLLAAILHGIDAARTRRGGPALLGAWALVAALLLQAALGVMTLLHRAPLALALLHQAMAILVLTIAAVHAARVAAVRSPALAGSRAVSSSP
jgi:cytochrome c oxidase assembly protein subunit 15